MLALVTADLHYSLPQFDWVARQMASVDWCFLCGDFLDLGGSVDLETQMVVVEKWAAKLNPKSGVILCSGNHDLEPVKVYRERQARWLTGLRTLNRMIDGDPVSVDGWRVSIIPWWDGPETLTWAREILDRDAQQKGRGWIWISHAPPSDSSVAWTGRADAGDPTIRNWVKEFKPDLVLCGHAHFAPFVSNGSWRDRIGPSVILNAGHQKGDWPAHILLDTASRTARWFAIEGGGECLWGSELNDA